MTDNKPFEFGPQLEKSFQRLERAAQRLNLLTDQMNLVIKEAQAALVSLKLGVTGEISVNESTLLGFGKQNNQWILYVARHGRKLKNDEWVPLANATRKERFECVPKLNDLLIHLVDQMEVEIGRVVEATEKAQEFIDAIKEHAGP